MSSLVGMSKNGGPSVREEVQDLIERFGPGAWTIVESRVRTAHAMSDRARQRCLARLLNRRLALASQGRA